MKYRNLGKYGIKLSEIALGSWVTDLSGAEAERIARETVDAAFDEGVNFFDCADAYSGGAAERFLGKALGQHERNEFVVSSKVFFPMGPGANDWGLSRKHITEQLDKTLLNMRLDYLDLYFCHRFDPTTPIEETVETLSDLVKSGKILYYGVSEWSPVQITEAIHIAKENNLRPLGVGITPFSPLAQGLLTGKYRKGQPLPEGSRATWQADKQINNLLTEDNLDKVEKLLALAEELNVPLSVLALAWILRKQQVTSVITGASRASQLRSNVAASGMDIPEYALAEIEEILDYHPFSRHIG